MWFINIIITYLQEVKLKCKSKLYMIISLRYNTTLLILLVKGYNFFNFIKIPFLLHNICIDFNYSINLYVLIYQHLYYVF